MYYNYLPVCVCVCAKLLQLCRLCATLWTVARQSPLSMRFSKQEHWIGLLCPPPGNLPDSGLKSTSLLSPALAGRVSTARATWEGHLPLYSLLFSLLMVSLDEQKFLILLSTVSFSPFTGITFVSCQKIFVYPQVTKIFSYVFFLKHCFTFHI